MDESEECAVLASKLRSNHWDLNGDFIVEVDWTVDNLRYCFQVVSVGLDEGGVSRPDVSFVRVVSEGP
jgi:hypothetical protein